MHCTHSACQKQCSWYSQPSLSLSRAFSPLFTVEPSSPHALLLPSNLKTSLSPASSLPPTCPPLLTPLLPVSVFTRKHPVSEGVFKLYSTKEPVFREHWGQDPVVWSLPLSLCHVSTLTTLSPCVHSPDKLAVHT